MNKKDLIKMPRRAEKKLIFADFLAGIDARRDDSAQKHGIGDTFNFCFSSGALTDGIGLKDLGLFSGEITALWRYSCISRGEDILMFATKNGAVYFVKNGVQLLHGVKVLGKVFAFNYRLYGSDVIVITSSDSPIVVWDGVNSAITVSDSPRMKSLDTYGGLMFIADADGQTLRYTAEPDPTNWNGPISEGGSLSLVDERGRINCAIAFLNYLYIFRDYGISRITISGGEPVHSGLFVHSGRIFDGTVRLCGDSVLFLSDDGIYSFDGLNSKRVLPQLSAIIQPDENAVAVFCSGKYYLACRLKTGDYDGYGYEGKVGCENGAFVNNALIVYCPTSGEYTLARGVDITALTFSDSRVFAVCGGRLSQLTFDANYLGEPLLKWWKSPFSDLGSERDKTVSRVYIETLGRITLSVITDSGVRSFDLEGSESPQCVRVDKRCKKLSLLIESIQPNARIRKPVICYCEL